MKHEDGQSLFYCVQAAWFTVPGARRRCLLVFATQELKITDGAVALVKLSARIGWSAGFGRGGVQSACVCPCGDSNLCTVTP
jgi:hypothetical protein